VAKAGGSGSAGGSGRSGGRGSKPSKEPKGLEGAIARGLAAKEAWVRDGLLVSREVLAQRWGVAVEEVAGMVARGELFELEVDLKPWVPAVFLGMPREAVVKVNLALAEAGVDSATAFVFWHRKHGALGGQTLLDVTRSQEGLGKVLRLAESFGMPRRR